MRSGREFQPYTHYCVGGNTKFWGSVLYRLRREDFDAIEHRDGISPAWPIDYDTLEPYYDRAERLYHVHGQHGVDPTEAPRGPYPFAPIPHADGMEALVSVLRRRGLHPSPLAARPDPPGRTGRMRALQHVQLVSVQAPREERSRRLLRASRVAAARTSSCGPTRSPAG